MNRNKGIIAILIGIGLFFISIFFSSGYHPRMNIIGNISEMEIVLVEAKYIKDPFSTKGPISKDIKDIIAFRLRERPYKSKTAIPLKYPLSLSVVIILLGTGIILMSKSK